jgi:lysophospholipase L1-like esterase
VGIGAVAALLAVVLGVEVVLARRGPRLAVPEAGSLDATVVPSGADPDQAPLRVVWLGDSTAAGVGASSPVASLPRQVAALLGRPSEVRVFARSGARVADVRRDQVPRVVALPAEERPDVVLVSVGANDVTHLTPKGRFQAEYLGVLDDLPDGPAVILLGVPDMGAIPRLAQPLRAVVGFRGSNLDQVVRALSRSNGADYVNIADFTGPAFRDDPTRYFAADDYHPSDDGYRLWADTVVPVVQWRLFYVENPDAEKPQPPPEAR